MPTPATIAQNPWAMGKITQNYGGEVPNGQVPQQGFGGATVYDTAPKTQSYFRYAGQPDRPSYSPSFDWRSMSLAPYVDQGLDSNQMNTQGLDKYRAEATRNGPSAWAALAQDQNGLQAKEAADSAARQAAGSTAAAESNLAMRGGLSSGARERMEAGGAAAALGAGQDVRRQAANNGLQIGMNDEQNRVTQLANLPGMEAQQHSSALDDIKTSNTARQFDIQNQVGEGDKQNLFNLQNYHEDMSAWAANKQANATQNSGKK